MVRFEGEFMGCGKKGLGKKWAKKRACVGTIVVKVGSLRGNQPEKSMQTFQ
jgi:hypothetical protein